MLINESKCMFDATRYIPYTTQSLIVLQHIFYIMLPEIYANQLCVEFLGKLKTVELYISQQFYTFPKQKSKIC